MCVNENGNGIVYDDGVSRGFLGFESEYSTVTKFKAEPLIPPNTPNVKDLGNIVKVTHRV